MNRKGYLLCAYVVGICLLLLDIVQGQVHEGPGNINSTAKENWFDRLRKDLLDGYDKQALPLQNHADKVTVRMGLSLMYVDVDEEKSTLKADVWIRMLWNDDKLTWDADAYGGVDVLRMSAHELWQPDIELYSSADFTDRVTYKHTHMVLSSDGEVLWVPPAHLEALCQMNFLHWPWEEHKCILRFGSWTYDGFKIDLNLYNNKNETDMEDFQVSNTKWEVTENVAEKNTKYYPCCEEPYIDVTFNLTLTRKSPTYRAILVAPVIVVVAVTLASFWFPPGTSERITIAGFNFLLLCIYLHQFGNALPARSDHIPSIVAFYSNTAVLVGVSIISSIISVTLCRGKHQYSAPGMIKRILSGSLGKLLLLGCYIDKVSSTDSNCGKIELNVTETGTTTSDNEKPSKQSLDLGSQLPAHNDWILVAAFFDRIIFLVYCVVFGVLMASCF